jgi:hypothetical protein
MVDSSWDNQAPVPSQGRGLAWGKILLGCGVAALLGVSALVVGGITFANRKLNDPAVKSELKKAFWPKVQDLAESLKTDEGTRDFYSHQKRLRERYPSEEAFLTQVKAWRPSLATIPPTMEAPGTLETRVSLQGIRLQVRLGDGRHLIILVQGQGKRRRLPVRDLEVR